MSDSQTDQRLSYKFQRLRERIRQEILDGELSGKFPGERELARRYQVNAKTVSKALSDLMSEGLLVREVGRGTFVRSDLEKEGNGRSNRRYHWVVDGLKHSSEHDRLYSMAAAEASDAGHQLSFDVLPPTSNGSIASGWLAPSALKNVDGVVVFHSRASQEFVSDLTRRRIPVVMADANCDSLKSNTVRPDYARGAFELTEYLADLGHKNIALVAPTNGPSFGHDAERGWRASLARRGLPAGVRCGSSRGDIDAALSRDVAPTGWVIIGTPTAKIVAEWVCCASPEAAVGVLAEPGQDDAVPRATVTYRFDAKVIAGWSIRLLNDATPGQSPREVVVPGQLTIGQPGAPQPGPWSSPAVASF